MEQYTIFLFLTTSVTLTLLPGPDILFLISTSLAQGWRKGLIVSIGLCSGLIIHTLIVILGLGAILQALPQAVRIIELFGAAYLLFIAYQLYKSPHDKPVISDKKKLPDRLFLTGFLMNISNPKVSLFFISFFPGFIFSKVMSYQLQFLILGSIFFVQALLLFILTAILVDYLGKQSKKYWDQVFWNKTQAMVLLLIALVLIYP